jgi:hypothetical protein
MMNHLKTLLLLACGAPCLLQAELLYVNANRFVFTTTDFTVASGDFLPTASSPFYCQNIWVFFSDVNDATEAEVVFEDGTTIPLPQSELHEFPGAQLAFGSGVEVSSLQELNAVAPSGQSYRLRFKRGLEWYEDTVDIPSDTDFFAAPPSTRISSNTLAQLMSYDASRPVLFDGDAESLWIGQLGGATALSEPLPFTVSADRLQPGVKYIASSSSYGPTFHGYTFAGFTRTEPNTPIIGVYLTSSEDFIFQTRPPHLRLTSKGEPAYNSVNQTTSMQVQLSSNPNYDAHVEFAERLEGSLVWTQTSAAFAQDGTASVILQKSGDSRINWNKQMFLRARNQQSPEVSQPNPSPATPL